MANRVHKSLMNAKIGFLFYFVSIFLAFFSRRIFLGNLGDQFMGLTGTLGSILGILNISEIGIGTCIGYFLYKPIETGDRDRICEIVSLFGWFYKIIGGFILFAGFIVSLFFPIIFAKEEMSLGIIYFTFFSFLGSNVISYFINYRQILLESDQKTYKISIWTQTGVVLKTIVQIFLTLVYKNIFLWVAIEFVFSLWVCWILNHIISREYPWLKTNRSNGKEILRRHPEIIKKTKQIFIHRMKNSLLSKCDEVFIYSFESLQMVTFFGNYSMIVGKLTALFNNVFTGMNASVGNLVAEGEKNNIVKVFWELLSFRYWITGVITISLIFLINPIISWWLGDQYVLSNHIVIIIILNMYIMLTRPSIDLFINAYGLYDDTWAAYSEGAINLTTTLVLGYYYGLIGILLGKTISMFFLVVIWKPYFLFKNGLKMSIIIYWKQIFWHWGILCSCITIIFLLQLITDKIPDNSTFGIFLFWISYIFPIIILYSLLIITFTLGSRNLINRIYKNKQQR